MWLREGLNPPDSVKAATAAYRYESNPITPFLDACCVRSEKAQLQAKPAFQAYTNFCQDTNIEPWKRLSDKAFHKNMRLIFQVTESRQTFYLGVGLKADGGEDRK